MRAHNSATDFHLDQDADWKDLLDTLTDTEQSCIRTEFYKSLSVAGNPEFATVLKLVRALGLQLQAAAVTISITQSR